jgi:hypothetical protein
MNKTVFNLQNGVGAKRKRQRMNEAQVLLAISVTPPAINQRHAKGWARLPRGYDFSKLAKKEL